MQQQPNPAAGVQPPAGALAGMTVVSRATPSAAVSSAAGIQHNYNHMPPPAPRAPTVKPSVSGPHVTAHTEATVAVGTTAAAATTTSLSTGAATGSAASQTVRVAGLIPLSTPKTVTVTFAPDWTQPMDVSQMSTMACNIWTLIVLFGPAGTWPSNARFKIQIRLLVLDPATPLARRTGEADVPIVGVHERAVLWARPVHGHAPYTRFSSAVVFSGTKIVPNDDLNVQSVILRPYADESDVHALVFHPPQNPHAAALATQTANPAHEQSLGAQGYFTMLHGKKYYLNVTFGVNSSIAQLVGGQEAWRPLAYVVKNGVRDGATATRGFTNFVTNWAQGTEVQPPDALERAWLADPQWSRLQQKQQKPHAALNIASAAAAAGAGAGNGLSISSSALHFNTPEARARRELLAKLGCIINPNDVSDIQIPLKTGDLHTPWNDVDQRFNLANVQLADDGGPKSGVALPSLDPRRFNLFARQMNANALPEWEMMPPETAQHLCLSLSSTRKLFTRDEWPLGFTLNALEAQARLYTSCAANPNPNNQLLDVAQRRLVPICRVLLSLFAVWNALPAWLHVARYMDDPQTYMAMQQWAQQNNEQDIVRTITTTINRVGINNNNMHQSALRDCLKVADNLLLRLCHRLAWVMAVLQATNRAVANSKVRPVPISASSQAAASPPTVTAAQAAGAPGLDPPIAAAVAAATRAVIQGVSVPSVDIKKNTQTNASSTTNDHVNMKDESPIDTALRVLAADRVWLQAASSFMTLTEERLRQLLTANPPRFQAYRDYCRPQVLAPGIVPRMPSGVNWPHSPELKDELERAGWTWKPTMLKRDRMVCLTCQAEVYGWHSWNSAWGAHFWSKHPPGSAPSSLVMPGSRIVTQLTLATPVALMIPADPLLTAPDDGNILARLNNNNNNNNNTMGTVMSNDGETKGSGVTERPIV